MDSAAIAPPPPGFTLDSPSSVPPPPSGFTLDAQSASTPTATISAAPKTSVGDVLENVAAIPTDPLGEIGRGIDYIRNKLLESDHPAAQEIGQKLTDAKGLLVGGSPVEGSVIGTGKYGLLNNPIGELIAAAPAAPEEASALEGKAGEVVDAFKLSRKAKAAKAEEEAAQQAVEAGNQVLKTKPKDFRNAVVPGRAIPTENVDPELVESANNARLARDTVAERKNLEAINEHLTGAIENLKEQQAVLLKHPTGEGFDIRPIVEDSYKKALGSAQQTGSPEIVKAINKAHEEMVKIPSDDGELIAERYLNFEGYQPGGAPTSAEEANEVKKTFQGRSNYKTSGGGTQDTPTQYANNFWKDVAAKVRTRLEEQVPGLGEVNQRIRDATAASKLAETRINTLRGMAPLPSRMDRFLKLAKPALVRGAGYALGGGAIYDLYHRFLSGE